MKLGISAAIRTGREALDSSPEEELKNSDHQILELLRAEVFVGVFHGSPPRLEEAPGRDWS